jgi:hypothetical protein
MAVVGFALEKVDSPKANWQENKQTFSRSFRVLVDDLADGPIIVLGALGLPLVGQFYAFGNESHPYCFCTSVKPERNGSARYWWDVEVEYETVDPKKVPAYGSEQQAQVDNPLVEIPEIDITTEATQEPVTGYYEEGDVFVTKAPRNSAGELFNPPPMRESNWPLLTISRNELISTPHPAIAVAYKDATNSDTFWGVPAGVAKFVGIDTKRLSKTLVGGTIFKYLRSTYKIRFRLDWDIRLLDAGSYFYPPFTETTRTFITRTGHPYIGLLDGNNGPLGGVDAKGYATPGTEPPVYLPAQRIYPRLPFSVFNLPGSFTA